MLHTLSPFFILQVGFFSSTVLSHLPVSLIALFLSISVLHHHHFRTPFPRLPHQPPFVLPLSPPPSPPRITQNIQNNHKKKIRTWRRPALHHCSTLLSSRRKREQWLGFLKTHIGRAKEEKRGCEEGRGYKGRMDRFCVGNIGK